MFGATEGEVSSMNATKKTAAKSKSAVASKTKKPAGKVASNTQNKRIPPPPGPKVSWDEQADYMEKYSLVQQEKAGYLVEVTDKKFLDDLAKSARAQRLREQREQVNVSLEPAQYLKLRKMAKRMHLSPSTLARCWLLERLSKEA